MTAKAIQDFLYLLTLFGHDGDPMCLSTIEQWLNKGIPFAVKQYHRYLSAAEVKVLKPQEINALVKKGYLIWTVEGLISANKGNALPVLNDKILMLKDLEKLSKFHVVVVKYPAE